MIDLYFWPTPNGNKITMMLEETELSYKIIPVDIRKGEQHNPDFLRVSPNNKIPAIVDRQNLKNGKALSIFETGAILLYLAEKTGQFLPKDQYNRYKVFEWLFWQVAGLGPMAGQNHYFNKYANEKVPHAIERYTKETNRLYTVLNKQLTHREYIADEYSIADMACYPWIALHEWQQQNLDDFPHLKRWYNSIGQRPATKRAYAKADAIKASPMDDAAKKILFGYDNNTD